MFSRVFPRCSMIAQAIAFNLFLAFFPSLLIAVAVATTRVGGKTSLLEMVRDLTEFLPPGSQGIVSEFLVNRGPDAWKIALLGWSGTLLAGSQAMKLVMEGIHIIYGDEEKPGFLHRQLRGLLLLLITIAPLLGAVILGVLGKPLRHWIAPQNFSAPRPGSERQSSVSHPARTDLHSPAVKRLKGRTFFKVFTSP